MGKKNWKNICIFSVCIIVLFIVVVTGFICLQLSLQKTHISPDILYITPPTTSFSGVIEEVEDNAIIVGQTVNIPKPPDSPDKSKTPAIPPRKLRYKVIVNPKTNIFKPFIRIPYLFKTVSPAPSHKPTFDDLKIGDFVSVVTTIDLRLLEKPEFEAVSVNYVYPSTNSFAAKIIDIFLSDENTILTVDASPPPPRGIPLVTLNPQQILCYEIVITPDTEISRLVSSVDFTKGPQPQRLNVTDLKKNMEVTIYTDGGISTKQRTKALLIRPVD
jgi:hypothetical protein